MEAAARNSADEASAKTLLGSLEDMHRRALERDARVMPRVFAAATALPVEEVG